MKHLLSLVLIFSCLSINAQWWNPFNNNKFRANKIESITVECLNCAEVEDPTACKDCDKTYIFTGLKITDNNNNEKYIDWPFKLQFKEDREVLINGVPYTYDKINNVANKEEFITLLDCLKGAASVPDHDHEIEPHNTVTSQDSTIQVVITVNSDGSYNYDLSAKCDFHFEQDAVFPSDGLPISNPSANVSCGSTLTECYTQDGCIGFYTYQCTTSGSPSTGSWVLDFAKCFPDNHDQIVRDSTIIHPYTGEVITIEYEFIDDHNNTNDSFGNKIPCFSDPKVEKTAFAIRADGSISTDEATNGDWIVYELCVCNSDDNPLSQGAQISFTDINNGYLCGAVNNAENISTTSNGEDVNISTVQNDWHLQGIIDWLNAGDTVCLTYTGQLCVPNCDTTFLMNGLSNNVIVESTGSIDVNVENNYGDWNFMAPSGDFSIAKVLDTDTTGLEQGAEVQFTVTCDVLSGSNLGSKIVFDDFQGLSINSAAPSSGTWVNGANIWILEGPLNAGDQATMVVRFVWNGGTFSNMVMATSSSVIDTDPSNDTSKVEIRYCPDMTSITTPAVTFDDATCSGGNYSGGFIYPADDSACDIGVLEYNHNDGGWTTSLPAYIQDQNNVVETRCNCDGAFSEVALASSGPVGSNLVSTNLRGTFNNVAGVGCDATFPVFVTPELYQGAITCGHYKKGSTYYTGSTVDVTYDFPIKALGNPPSYFGPDVIRFWAYDNLRPSYTVDNFQTDCAPIISDDRCGGGLAYGTYEVEHYVQVANFHNGTKANVTVVGSVTSITPQGSFTMANIVDNLDGTYDIDATGVASGGNFVFTGNFSSLTAVINADDYFQNTGGLNNGDMMTLTWGAVCAGYCCN